MSIITVWVAGEEFVLESLDDGNSQVREKYDSEEWVWFAHKDDQI